MDSGVYQIRHVATGHLYVGSSTELTKRFKAHRRLLEKGTHHSPRLQFSWNKDGPGSFVFELLETCDPGVVFVREQFYFDTLKPVFNAAPISGSRRGVPHSAASKAKLSGAHLDRKRAPE